MSANSVSETSPVLPTAQGGLSQYFAPVVLFGSQTIDVALPVMKTTYLYAAMMLSVVNKVPVWSYAL